MHAASNGYIDTLPHQWEHDPDLKDKDGSTVAMCVD